jgi:N-dimethylarginine dimethylaminohydrolase
MRSEFRRAEVSFFQDWYAKQGYAVHLLETRNCTFEGNGDALLQQSEGLIWGGFGPRTSRASYEEVSRCTGFPVAVLELVSEHFYHLDTCFSILNDQTVAIVPEAFTEAGRQLIAAGFSQVIPIDQREALEAFAGNCHCPNGKDVILHPGSPKLMNLLKKAGFSVHELDTSEFLKSGGSVFCLKMMVF